ncbi:hypothetical protein FYM55_09805 [Staphylococcus aureus]|nr:hypothetical protein FYM42_13475 [Staphylococcus aureus]TYO45440.1 hypothetical protein FYM55_09805 [Staphylococcus aureus]TYO52125.1 hypothetical protein FYM51_14445 [Staphylococcus aureus]
MELLRLKCASSLSLLSINVKVCYYSLCKEKIKSSLFTNGSYTFVGDKVAAIASAKIEFIEFID